MSTTKFKSNLKCMGCVSAIKPFMDSLVEINSWKVDLENPDKIIEIETDKTPDKELLSKVISGVKEKGYQIEISE